MGEIGLEKRQKHTVLGLAFHIEIEVAAGVVLHDISAFAVDEVFPLDGVVDGGGACLCIRVFGKHGGQLLESFNPFIFHKQVVDESWLEIGLLSSVGIVGGMVVGIHFDSHIGFHLLIALLGLAKSFVGFAPDELGNGLRLVGNRQFHDGIAGASVAVVVSQFVEIVQFMIAHSYLNSEESLGLVAVLQQTAHRGVDIVVCCFIHTIAQEIDS